MSVIDYREPVIRRKLPVANNLLWTFCTYLLAVIVPNFLAVRLDLSANMWQKLVASLKTHQIASLRTYRVCRNI